MNSKHIRGDFNFAWPSAEIAVMALKAPWKLIFKKDIAAAENPEDELNNKLFEYIGKFANPYIAAERGYIDDVIFPHETKVKLVNAFTTSKNES